MRILIADDMPLFRNVLKFILDSQPDYQVIDILENVDSLVNECRVQAPDLVIMKTFLFYQNNALAAAKLLKKTFPNIKVLIIMETNKAALIEEAKLHLADGVIAATAEPQDFIACVRSLEAGEHIFPDLDDNKWGPWKARLTDREKDAIRLICMNLTYEEMAKELKVTKRTVSFHISNILNKTGHKNITGLILEAAHKGYLTAWKN